MGYLQTDFIGLALLAVIYFYGRLNSKRQTGQSVFNALLLAALILLICDILVWLPEGRSFPGARMILNVFTFLYDIVGMTLGAIWLLYCDSFSISVARTWPRKLCYCAPFTLHCVLMLSNFWTGAVYYYDESNNYCPGPLQPLQMIMHLSYMVISVILILYRARRVQRTRRKDLYSLLLFIAPPFAGAIIQSLVFGVSLLPNCIAISMLIIFVQRMSALITIDPLTGLANRRQFSIQLDSRFKNPTNNQKLFLFLMDANDFKAINDSFGHLTGDEALIHFGAALRRVAKRGDCLARLGGDEFVLLGQREDEAQVAAIAKSIAEELVLESQNHPYQLSLSTGYTIYDPLKHTTTDMLIQDADSNMYANKKNYKHSAK